MAIDQLLLQSRKGFERIVFRHRDRVFGYAYHMLGDRDEAADVAQEVFIRLWNHREKMKRKRLLPWLLSVTRNACIDVLRHRQTVNRVIDRDEFALETAQATDVDPVQNLETDDFQRRLQEGLTRLSEPQRSIVILRELQDMSYAEIAAALDLPLTTVKVYLHRGRRTLREELSDLVAERGKSVHLGV